MAIASDPQPEPISSTLSARASRSNWITRSDLVFCASSRVTLGATKIAEE
jgi:hypothetical protein